MLHPSAVCLLSPVSFYFPPFFWVPFTLGVGQVIKGWDEGLQNMCVGEKRKLVIPSGKGYGAGGSPPKIPGGATLVFETELLSINGK
jgi:FK506-binding protein 2